MVIRREAGGRPSRRSRFSRYRKPSRWSAAQMVQRRTGFQPRTPPWRVATMAGRGFGAGLGPGLVTARTAKYTPTATTRSSAPAMPCLTGVFSQRRSTPTQPSPVALASDDPAIATNDHEREQPGTTVCLTCDRYVPKPIGATVLLCGSAIGPVLDLTAVLRFAACYPRARRFAWDGCWWS